MESKLFSVSGETETKTIREFGVSTRFKGSKTIYMLLEEEKNKNKV
jgi:hypothetical protein